jgi:alpha-tubulin suppressor-like RCC1 family protein
VATKLHKLFTGIAVLSIGLSSCLVMAPAASAGEIPLNGVFVWGQNANGSLGTGDTSMTPTPKVTAEQILNVTKIATSSTHTLYLDNEGNVYASGDNFRGQLGTGDTTSSTTPVRVELPLRYGVPDYATQVWAGDGVSFMRGSYGDVYSWGSNDKGRTGLGETSGDTLVPTKIPGLFLNDENKEKLSISSTAVAAVHHPMDNMTPPQLYTWGENPQGILGRPSAALDPVVSSPQRVLINDPNEERNKWVDDCDMVTDPDTGESHEECTSVEVPKTYDELLGLSPERVAVGKNFFVAVTGNSIHTWGVNDKGQLGMALPATTVKAIPTTSPALVLEQFASVYSVSAGEDHVILLGSDGLVYGWGDNSKSQVAPYYSGSTQQSYLNVLQRLTIKKEVSDSSSWSYVETGDDSSYAVTTENDAYGWGDNSTGEIANTKDVIVQSPERIVFPYATEISSFAAGGNNAAAVSDYVISYPDISISTSTEVLPAVLTHTDYSYTLTSANGYPGKNHTWTIYGLPEGLTYDSNTGNIHGQSTEIGTFDIEARVTDNVAQATKNFKLEIAKSIPDVDVTYSNLTPGTSRATINVAKDNAAANGTVTLTYGTATKTATLADGKATIDFTGTAGSQEQASVKYNGSETMNTASSNLASVIITPKYASTMTATYKSNNPGQITATINVTQGANKGTGPVVFQYGTAKATANLVNGTAVITVNAVAGTTYAVSASYAGSTTLAPSSVAATKITTMKKRNAAVTATYASNRPGELTATVTVKDGAANGTGTVTFYVGTAKRTVTLVNGKAAIAIAAKPGTRYTVKTVYSGSAYLNALTTPAKIATTRAKYNSAPIVSYKVVGRTVTPTITLRAAYGLTPTGIVRIYDGTRLIKTVTLSKGTARTSFAVAGGTHKFKVVYAGDAYFNAYSSSVGTLYIR